MLWHTSIKLSKHLFYNRRGNPWYHSLPQPPDQRPPPCKMPSGGVFTLLGKKNPGDYRWKSFSNFRHSLKFINKGNLLSYCTWLHSNIFKQMKLKCSCVHLVALNDPEKSLLHQTSCKINNTYGYLENHSSKQLHFYTVHEKYGLDCSH